MIYVIMGKSATGKDTVFDKLIKNEELGLTRIVPYTTRPVRTGEIDGREYHFVDEEEMNRLATAGLIAEHREYNTVNGVWHYFTVDDNPDIHNSGRGFAMIATLEAYVSLREYYGRELVVPVYIQVDDYERLKRAVNRERKQTNPNYEEVCRRYIADEQDFSPDKLKAAGITVSYSNRCLKDCVEQICRDIASNMQ